MRQDGKIICIGCGHPRRVFVVFEDKRGDFESCSVCVAQDLAKRKAATMTSRSRK